MTVREIAKVTAPEIVTRLAKVVAKTHAVAVALIPAPVVQNNRECRKPYRVGENL